jgi:hypothetical protein
VALKPQADESARVAGAGSEQAGGARPVEFRQPGGSPLVVVPMPLVANSEPAAQLPLEGQAVAGWLAQVEQRAPAD